MRVLRWWPAVIAVGGCTGAFWLLTVLFGGDVPVLVWFGLAVVLVVGYRLIGRVAAPADSEALLREESEATVFAMPDRPFAGMRAWEERLELMRGDGDYFRRTLVPMLTALVEERARLEHGIDARESPERMRGLLGPRTAALLYPEGDGKSTARAPSRADLDALVTELETLWTNHR